MFFSLFALSFLLFGSVSLPLYSKIRSGPLVYWWQNSRIFVLSFKTTHGLEAVLDGEQHQPAATSQVLRTSKDQFAVEKKLHHASSFHLILNMFLTLNRVKGETSLEPPQC